MSIYFNAGERRGAPLPHGAPAHHPPPSRLEQLFHPPFGQKPGGRNNYL